MCTQPNVPISVADCCKLCRLRRACQASRVCLVRRSTACYAQLTQYMRLHRLRLSSTMARRASRSRSVTTTSSCLSPLRISTCQERARRSSVRPSSKLCQMRIAKTLSQAGAILMKATRRAMSPIRKLTLSLEDLQVRCCQRWNRYGMPPFRLPSDQPHSRLPTTASGPGIRKQNMTPLGDTAQNPSVATQKQNWTQASPRRRRSTSTSLLLAHG
jgi:hypothetical protein